MEGGKASGRGVVETAPDQLLVEAEDECRAHHLTGWGPAVPRRPTRIRWLPRSLKGQRSHSQSSTGSKARRVASSALGERRPSTCHGPRNRPCTSTSPNPALIMARRAPATVRNEGFTLGKVGTLTREVSTFKRA